MSVSCGRTPTGVCELGTSSRAIPTLVAMEFGRATLIWLTTQHITVQCGMCIHSLIQSFMRWVSLDPLAARARTSSSPLPTPQHEPAQLSSAQPVSSRPPYLQRVSAAPNIAASSALSPLRTSKHSRNVAMSVICHTPLGRAGAPGKHRTYVRGPSASEYA